jgi:hypothetical protein
MGVCLSGRDNHVVLEWRFRRRPEGCGLVRREFGWPPACDGRVESESIRIPRHAWQCEGMGPGRVGSELVPQVSGPGRNQPEYFLCRQTWPHGPRRELVHTRDVVPVVAAVCLRADVWLQGLRFSSRDPRRRREGVTGGACSRNGQLGWRLARLASRRPEARHRPVRCRAGEEASGGMGGLSQGAGGVHELLGHEVPLDPARRVHDGEHAGGNRSAQAAFHSTTRPRRPVYKEQPPSLRTSAPRRPHQAVLSGYVRSHKSSSPRWRAEIRRWPSRVRSCPERGW